MFVSNFRQVCGFLPVFQFPQLIKWPPLCNWNIVESGAKHHQTNKQKNNLYFTVCIHTVYIVIVFRVLNNLVENSHFILEKFVRRYQPLVKHILSLTYILRKIALAMRIRIWLQCHHWFSYVLFLIVKAIVYPFC